MTPDYFRTMLDYQYWCRDRLLGATAGMSDDELTRPNGFTYGSILGILAHTLGGEWAWFERMQGRTVEPGTAPNKDTVKSIADLEERWREAESEARAFVAGLVDPEQVMVLRGRDGVDRSWKLWQLLTLVSTHSKQHGSEAAEALTMAGHSPGDLDFPVYLRSLE